MFILVEFSQGTRVLDSIAEQFQISNLFLKSFQQELEVIIEMGKGSH